MILRKRPNLLKIGFGGDLLSGLVAGYYRTNKSFAKKHYFPADACAYTVILLDSTGCFCNHISKERLSLIVFWVITVIVMKRK